MNCEQKSGIFLNIKCNNNVKHECSNCEKQVCKTHLHRYIGRDLCENCYWETYIYSKEKIVDDYDYHNETTIIGFPSTTNNNHPVSFEEEFGGGEFGGGGASSSWTEGELESFNDTSTEINGSLLGDADSTFFYS